MISRQERTAKIEHEIAEPRDQASIPFRGARERVSVIRVPIDLPIYRIRNGRTRVEQFEYADKNDLPSTFFDRGEEDEAVQDAQYAILLRMSKDPKGDIYRELARVAEQRDPLIATSAGVIVNGNRRLAAMRSLHDENPSAYGNFGFVDLAILPKEANERDLEDIETELQEVPETKLDYGWIERRLKMRYQHEQLGVKRAELRVKYRLRSEEDVVRELAQLSLAEEYLEYIGKAKTAYWEVAQSEEIFKRLQAALTKNAGDASDVRRLIGFALIKSAPTLRDRVYKFHPIFGDDFDKVIDRYVEAYQADEDPPSEPGEVSSKIGESDILEQFAPPEDSRLAPLRDALAKPERAAEVAKGLVTVYKAIDLEEQEDDLRKAAAASAATANRLLQEINIAGADPKTFSALRAQLAAAQEAIIRLLKQLDAALSPKK